MRASSIAALKAARSLLQAEWSTDTVHLQMQAGQFFSLADLGRANLRLVNAFTDPARDLKDKENLFAQICPLEQVDELVQKVNLSLFSARWSQAVDLIEVWEELGLEVEIWAAKQVDKLALIRDELFAIDEFINRNRKVRQVLTDRKAVAPQQRVELANKLFADQVSDVSLKLFNRAILVVSGAKISAEHRSLDSQLRHYQERIAGFEAAETVIIKVSRPLLPTQYDRIRQILEKKLGQSVVINTGIDPTLVGGIKIQIGSQIYDGSVATVLHQTKQKLVG